MHSNVDAYFNVLQDTIDSFCKCFLARFNRPLHTGHIPDIPDICRDIRLATSSNSTPKARIAIKSAIATYLAYLLNPSAPGKLNASLQQTHTKELYAIFIQLLFMLCTKIVRSINVWRNHFVGIPFELTLV